jgi:sugar/nucleoside kinase (ribokinase family)
LSVFVAGNLVLDQLVWPVDRVRWDGTVWVEKLVRSLGGNGANTAYTLAALGQAVQLAGAIGADAEGAEVLSILNKVGVDTSRVVTVDAPTPATVALVKRSGARAFLHRPGASKVSLTEALVMTEARHFHLANPFAVPALRRLGPENLRRAREAGMTTSVDTGWDSKGEWGEVILPCCAYADVLFLNAEEGRLITGERSAQRTVRRLHEAGVKYVLLKQGKRGARVSGPGFSALAPGFAVEAVDSTGAGDVFAGAFLAAWLRGQSVTEAAQFANAAAALSVMEVGSVAGVRDFKQTLTWMRQAQSSGPRA